MFRYRSAQFHDLLDEIPEGHILLMDDLYNCYEILNKCITEKIYFVVPAKRKRNFKVLRSYGKGDEMRLLKSPNRQIKDELSLPKITLRKIDCISPDGEEYTDGQRVENELKQLIRKQILPNRSPGCNYTRKTKKGKC